MWEKRCCNAGTSAIIKCFHIKQIQNNNFNDLMVYSIIKMNSTILVSRSTTYLVLAAIFASLLSFSPLAHAQNTTNSSEISQLYNQAKNTTVNLVNQAPAELKSAYNQAKNTTVNLVNQAPAELKSAYNQAKNTTVNLVDQAATLIKNDTNSTKLLNQLENDFGSLINEFKGFFSR